MIQDLAQLLHQTEISLSPLVYFSAGVLVPNPECQISPLAEWRIYLPDITIPQNEGKRKMPGHVS